MPRYRIEVQIVGTLYVTASSPEDAAMKAGSIENESVSVKALLDEGLTLAPLATMIGVAIGDEPVKV